jgi:hypothetical protein
MPICPSCRSEYQAGTKKCPECDVVLVDKLANTPLADDTIDLYACYETQQAERLAEILEEESIDVLVRDCGSNVFPTNVGKNAQRIIAVPSSAAARARELITAAIKDGIVPNEGELLAG